MSECDWDWGSKQEDGVYEELSSKVMVNSGNDGQKEGRNKDVSEKNTRTPAKELAHRPVNKQKTTNRYQTRRKKNTLQKVLL